MYISKDFYIFNQVKSRLMYLFGTGIIGLYICNFCYLVNILTSIKDFYLDYSTNKANICIKKILTISS